MQTRWFTLALATVVTIVVCGGAVAQDSHRVTEETYRDIQATLGVVPSFPPAPQWLSSS
jgi:hypothetical protein